MIVSDRLFHCELGGRADIQYAYGRHLSDVALGRRAAIADCAGCVAVHLCRHLGRYSEMGD